jgi:ribosomal protein S17E
MISRCSFIYVFLDSNVQIAQEEVVKYNCVCILFNIYVNNLRENFTNIKRFVQKVIKLQSNEELRQI